ncbi:protein jag [Candidatus Poribacteria bacterium]|nr:MAG: protein jag [Candidatus Poribacteria bacterium]
MQNYIETEGTTVDEAIERALTQLNVAREEVTIDILSEPTKGILKFGAKPAKVRATRREDADSAPDTILKELLNRMGINADIEAEEIEGNTQLNMLTDVPALLIGRHGQTLDALERLLNCILNKESDARNRVFIDAAGYRVRREQSIVELAHQVAAKVRHTGREVVLAPMSPRDRRIIHLTLKTDNVVHTYSQGEGDTRRVVVTTEEP